MSFPNLHINNPILKRELEAAFRMLMTLKGNMYFVHSTTGSAYSAGTDIDHPMATLDDAINKCTANQGDIIIMLPGHAETISTASAIDVDIAGIKVYGIGEGEDRPKITISGLTGACIEFAANSTVFKNVIIIGAIDALTTPILLKGVGLDIDVETRDSTNLIEATTWFLSEATCNHLKLKTKHIGFTDGSGNTSYIKLIGADYPRIEVDYFGKANTSVIEFSGTSAINAIITKSFIYNQGDVTYSKFVVDTIGGSTWLFSGVCGENGTSVQGSQDTPIAGLDTSAVAAALAIIDAFHDVPVADTADNIVMSNVLGNKSDTVAGTSAISLLKQIYARAGAPAGASMSADIAAIKAVTDIIASASVTEIAEILAAVDAEIAQILAALVVVDEFQDVPGIDSAANAQTNEVIGNKSDTVAGNSLIALCKQVIAALLFPTQDLATDATIAQVVGKKSDTVAGTSLIALCKQVIAALAFPTQDLATDATIAQVVGKKSDTVAGTSLVALAKQIIAAIVVVDGLQDVPTQNLATNDTMNQVVGNKTDTVAGTSLYSLAKQLLAKTKDLNYSDPNYLAVSVDLSNATWNTAAAHEVLTVTGLVRLRMVIECTETLVDTTDTGTIALGVEGDAAAWIAASDTDNVLIGTVWADNTPGDTHGNFSSLMLDKIVNGVDVGYTIAGEALTNGTLVFHCWWEPVNGAGAVVAGAGGVL